MKYIKEQAAAQVNVRAISQFLGLASLATLLPFYIHWQWATGPLVNALLIIALFLIGIRSALLLCLIPSLMALAGGLIPPLMAPILPFIMISNVIFVLLVDYFYANNKDNNKGYWTGLMIGAAAKFIFLFFSVGFVGDIIIKQELMVKIAQMFSWPQFITAVTGGMIAWAALKWLKRI